MDPQALAIIFFIAAAVSGIFLGPGGYVLALVFLGASVYCCMQISSYDRKQKRDDRND